MVPRSGKSIGRKSTLDYHRRHPKIVLIGQPNCGKSTLFNEVAGYRSISANFPGATVTYTQSHVRILGNIFDLIDLPGVYSLTSFDEADRETQRYLLSEDIDVIINVVDSSLLSRSLELTLQLMDLEIPMVMCLNMVDEAERKGIKIDIESLSEKLGISVVPTVASKGRGVTELFEVVFKTAQSRKIGRHIRMSRDVELVVAQLTRHLKQTIKDGIDFSYHLLATKLLEKDQFFENVIKDTHPEIMDRVYEFQQQLALSHGRSSDQVIDAERHSLSMSIFEDVVKIVKNPHLHWKERIDNVLMHNLWGYMFLVLFLFIFFNLIFRVGSIIEAPMMELFNRIVNSIQAHLGTASLLSTIISGAVQGIGGGVAIVLPYLLPFLFGLALLEDIGYLPRVAFLMDAFMHRIGLHGKAVIPAVLGYGCNVPAVLATRILESPRDRFIASLISTMVPCAARMTVILGLVGYYLGGSVALIIYFTNIVVIAITGRVVSRMMPEVTPGMAIEIPAYQLPQLRVILMKTWLRIKDFIIIAWPLLIIGSIVLSIVEHYNFSQLLNQIISPVTTLLGLPRKVGLTLIFGVFRKELSMLMLFQAMGTNEILTVMSKGQILVFTTFIVYYVPCVATIGVLAKQIGWKSTWIVVVFMFILALVIGMITRGLSILIW